MKRIVVILLGVLVILSIFANGCAGGPCISYDAPIGGITIWADNSSPPQYFLDVEYGFASCDGYSGSYEVTRVGNTTIEVNVFNGTCDQNCPVDRYATLNISLGSDFVLGVNYTVEVNDVTVTFVA